MEERNDYLDKVERIFDGELDKSHLRDDALKEDAAFFEGMIEALGVEELERGEQALEDIDIDRIDPDIRAQLAAQNKKLSTAKVRKLTPIRRILAIAASVLVLIVSGLLLWNKQTNSPAALAEDYYLDADLPGTMSGGAVMEENFQAGLVDFAVKEDFETAKIAFQQIGDDSPRYTEAQYFLGHIAFQNEDFVAAENAYTNALAAENLPGYIDRNRVAWNLMLAQLANGKDIEEALKNFLPTATPFDEMARALLEELQ
ncbi:MAG: hypothetical protein AAGI23_21395 [Bacteroidota bacterium]